MTQATNGLITKTPTSVSAIGGTATINADGSVTFSGCTAIGFNGIFDGSTRYYLINADVLGVTAGDTVHFYYRNAGVADGNVNYKYQVLNVSSTSVSGSRSTSSNRQYAGRMTNFSGANSGFALYLYDGAVDGQQKRSISKVASGVSGANINDYANHYNLTSNADGIHFYSISNTFSGTITVFAFNQ